MRLETESKVRKKKRSKSQSFENPPKAPNLEIWLPQLGGE